MSNAFQTGICFRLAGPPRELAGQNFFWGPNYDVIAHDFINRAPAYMRF